MTIIIPTNESNENGVITDFKSAKYYAELNIDEDHQIETIKYYTDIEAFFDTCDYVIISSDHDDEDMSEYVESGIEVLMASPNSDIDEIFESFTFRELHEFV
jgi:hypothetical protein